MPTNARNPITIDLGTLTNGGRARVFASGETVSACGCELRRRGLIGRGERSGRRDTRLPAVKAAADEGEFGLCGHC